MSGRSCDRTQSCRHREPRRRLGGRGGVFEHYEGDDIPGMTMKGDIAEDGEGVKAAWFKDTEGNYLCIHEDIAPA